jgi:hypothetical protein
MGFDYLKVGLSLIGSNCVIYNCKYFNNHAMLPYKLERVIVEE